MARISVFILLFYSLLALAQTAPEARFQPVFENDTVNVDSIEMPPRSRAPLFQNTHDVVWIALDGARLGFTADSGKAKEVSMRAGDVRLLRSFEVRTVHNLGESPARAVVVQIQKRALTSPGCFCTSAVEKALCGCSGAGALPDLWAVGVGSVMFSGATMSPGQGYRHGMRRNDMLLVAISAAQLQDAAAETGVQSIVLKAGEVRWIPAGTHQLLNTGEAPAKLVTIEF